MKNIATLVGGAVVAAGLMASPAYANHETCEVVGNKFANYVAKSKSPREVTLTYGGQGQVGPEKYNTCVVDTFNQGIAKLPQGKQGYKLEVTLKNPKWKGGTTYALKKK